MRDISADANAALTTTGYYRAPGGQVTMSGVVVPANAVFDGAGTQITCPASARFCLELGGVNAKAENLNAQGAAAVGILVSNYGARLRDCQIEGFGTGLKSDVAGITAVLSGGSFCDGLSILNSTAVGIDWVSPSDCQFSNIVVAKASHGNAQFAIRTAGGSGVWRDCHVWGSHEVGFEFGSVNGYMSGCRIEGARQTLLRLTDWRIIVRDTFLYYPVEEAGVPSTIAIEIGSLVTGKDSCHNDVEVTILQLGSYNYKRYLQHNHGKGSNRISFTFQDVGQPISKGIDLFQSGPFDVVSILSPIA